MRRPGNSHKRRWLLAGLCLLLAGAAIWRYSRPGAKPVIPMPPEISVRAATPGLHAAFESARNEVLAQPHSGAAWGRLGMLLFANEYDQETTSCLEQARRLEPQEFRWPYLLGVHLAVSAPEAAAEQFREALRIRPDSAVAHLRLGELLLSLEQFDASAVHLRRALELDRQSARAACAMARLAVQTGDAEAALPWAEFAAQSAPTRRATRETLGLVYHRLNRREEALRELAAAEQLPNTPLGWEDPIAAEVLSWRRHAADSLEYSDRLMAQGQVAEAIAVLNEALQEDRRDPSLFCALARAHLKKSDLQRADEVLRQAEGAHPHSAEVQFQRGVVEFLRGDYQNAVTRFRAATELKPDYTLAHYNLGHGLIKMGENKQAVAAFEAAVHLRPDHVHARINLARALLAEGDSTAALAHLSTAAQLAPQDREVQEMLRKHSAPQPAP